MNLRDKWNVIADVHEEYLPEWTIGEFISKFESWYERSLRYVPDADLIRRLKDFATQEVVHQKFINGAKKES